MGCSGQRQEDRRAPLAVVHCCTAQYIEEVNDLLTPTENPSCPSREQGARMGYMPVAGCMRSS